MSVNNRYSPYALPRTDDEARAYYQALYGFRTQGAHLGLVRQLLGDAHHACPTCKGAGLYGTYGGLGALNCPACRGLGVAYTISLDELEKRRRQIIDRYPGAAIPNWQPYRPIRLPIVDPATGIVFDAAPGGPEPIQLELAFS